MTFERWSDRIVAAEDEHARRELLAEIGRWRAEHLTDIPALREAAYAMSRLYALLGDHQAAVREARSLLSLCQTPPTATPEEIQAAEAYLESLGARGVLGENARKEKKKAPRPEPPAAPRSKKKEKGRPGREASLEKAAREAAEGRWSAAVEHLEGRTGARAELLRTWIVLARALGEDEPSLREKRIRDLEARLRARVLAGAEPAAQAVPDAASPEVAEDAHPLAKLLGERVPRKWRPRLRKIEGYLAEHPEQADAIAAHALDHHVAVIGEKAPAPWLIGVTGAALARGEAQQTRAKLEELTEQGAYAVTAYQEPEFGWMVAVWRVLLAEGVGGVDLRRGVSSRIEPRGRRLWTLRFDEGDGDRLIVLGAPQEEPYADGLPARLAARIVHLCPRSALYAPGQGNAALREAASQAGIAVVDTHEPRALIEAVRAVGAAEEPEPTGGGGGLDALRQLLDQDPPPSAQAIQSLLADHDRVHPAFRVAREVIEGKDQRQERVVAFLAAADAVAPDKARLPEGITLATRAAAVAGGEGPARDALVEGPLAPRYGGPGVEHVVEIATVLAEQGWRTDRVLRGPTARERRGEEVLQAFDDRGEGLWRQRVLRDGVQGDVWFLSDLSDQGREAVGVLHREAGQHVLVVADDGNLVEWAAEVGAAPIRWTDPGTAGQALVEAVDAWSSD